MLRISAYLLTLVLAVIATGCKWLDQDVGRDNSDGSEVAAVDTGSASSGTISADSTETQTLTGTGEISGAAVAFPPGSLAVNENVSLGEGGDVSSVALSEVGVDANVTSAAKSVIIDSDGDADPTGTLAVTVPLPAEGAGLALQGQHLVVVYKVVIKSLGVYLSGIIPQSAFKGFDAASGTATIDTTYFGQFQAIYIDKEVAAATSKESTSDGFVAKDGTVKTSKVKTGTTDGGTDGGTDGTTDGGEEDTIGPIGTLTTAVLSPTNVTTVPFQIAWNEDVKDFTAADVTVSSGTITNFSGSGKTFTFNVNPTTDGVINISVAAKTLTDIAGNPNAVINGTVIYDSTEPEVAFSTPTTPYSVTLLENDGLAVTGTCSENDRAITATGSAEPIVTDTCTNNAWSLTLTFDPAQPGDKVVTVTQVDAAGNVGTAEATFVVRLQASVVTRFTDSFNWLSINKDDNRDVACTGLETSPNDCFDAGRYKKIDLSGIADCGDVDTITDVLGMFEWECDDSTNDTFIKGKIRPEFRIADTIDENTSTFKMNAAAIIDPSGLVIAETQPAAWWGNTINELTATSAVQTLTGSGTIHYVSSDMLTGGFNLNSDRMALVIATSATLSADPLTTSNVSSTTAEVASANRTAMVGVGDQDFIHIEGRFNGDGDLDGAGETEFGILAIGSNFLNLRDIDIDRTGSGVAPAAIRIYDSLYAQLHNISVQRGAGNGIFIGAGSPVTTEHRLHRIQAYGFGDTCLEFDQQNQVYAAHIRASNCTGYGLLVSNAGQWFLTDVISSYNTLSAMKFSSVNQLGMGNASALTSFGDGITFLDVTNSILANTLAMGNEDDGVRFFSSSSVGLYNYTAQQNTAGPFRATNTDTNSSIDIFGNLVADLTNCLVDITSGNFQSCTAGDAVVNQNASEFTDLFADSATTAAGPSPDFTDLENDFQTWGNGNNATSLAADSVCGSTCRRWDWRYSNSYAGALAGINGPFTPNAACPVNGNDKIDALATSFLKNAVELVGKDGGNQNGLCESGETCLFTPNIGAYQGEGQDLAPCVFTDGALTGITLIGKEFVQAQ